MSRRTTDALRALAAEGHALAVDAQSCVSWAVATFGHRLAVSSSMSNGALAHFVAQSLPSVDVLFLDTGYHFPETIATRDDVAARLPVTVVDVRPRQTVAQQDQAYGRDAYSRDPWLCCRLRKVLPLDDALMPYEAWASGIRRGETPQRANAQYVEFDGTRGLVKINPFVEWSERDLAAYIVANDIPVNPLEYQGYPSIGCAPCTSKVAAGEDSRSGRWRGLGKDECGINI
ncbi:MAG: phosphoadenylyl-sulfate reductase [Candidatus Nanopelagicales bacterium]